MRFEPTTHCNVHKSADKSGADRWELECIAADDWHVNPLFIFKTLSWPTPLERPQFGPLHARLDYAAQCLPSARLFRDVHGSDPRLVN